MMKNISYETLKEAYDLKCEVYNALLMDYLELKKSVTTNQSDNKNIESLSVGDIVTINDIGYLGLYEITTIIDIAEYPDFFEYDYFVTNNECETEIPVKCSDLIPVCKAKNRLDLS